MEAQQEQQQQQRRSYTEEFKREAVRLVSKDGQSESQVARDLQVSRSLLGKWRRQIQAEHSDGHSGSRAFPGQGKARDEELARLQRENVRLKEEVEILKKAVGIFTNRPLRDAPARRR